jgi:hypothetical protein
VIKSLVRAAEEAPRPYKFVLLSDHGQSLGATFLPRSGKTLKDVISGLMGGAASSQSAVEPGDSWGPINAALSEAGQTEGATGAITRRVTKGSMTDGTVDIGGASEDSTPAPAGGPPELVVGASGNLGLVYFAQVPGRVTVEEMGRRWPGLVEGLARHEGVGLVMARSEQHGTVAIGARGTRFLDEDRVEGEDPVAPFGEHADTGLRRVSGMEHCGDLMVISLLDPATDEVAAFEELIGSHGGLGGPQTHPFILHPAEWSIDEPIVGAEAVYRQIRRWLEGVGITLGKGGVPAVAAAAASAVASPAEGGAKAPGQGAAGG